MYIIDSPKPFGIICHPKTGSQSTQYALRKAHNARVVRGQHYYDEDECRRLRALGLLICFVRNPFDTMVSWYHYMEDAKQYNGQYPNRRPFPEWLDWILENGNGWVEKGLFYGAEECNRVLRFENGVQNQLNECLAECDLEPVELPWRGKSTRTHFRDYYDSGLRLKILKRFHHELYTFGYSFED